MFSFLGVSVVRFGESDTDGDLIHDFLGRGIPYMLVQGGKERIYLFAHIQQYHDVQHESSDLFDPLLVMIFPNKEKAQAFLDDWASHLPNDSYIRKAYEQNPRHFYEVIFIASGPIASSAIIDDYGSRHN